MWIKCDKFMIVDKILVIPVILVKTSAQNQYVIRYDVRFVKT